MVAVDYSFRDSEYYTKWYKQGIVPADNLFMGYQFITGALGSITSIFSALKSDDAGEGGGGGGLGGAPIAEDEGPTVQEQTENERTKNDFIAKYNAWEKDTTKAPSEELKELAKKVKNIPNVHSTILDKVHLVEIWKKHFSDEQIAAIRNPNSSLMQSVFKRGRV